MAKRPTKTTIVGELEIETEGNASRAGSVVPAEELMRAGDRIAELVRVLEPFARHGRRLRITNRGAKWATAYELREDSLLLGHFDAAIEALKGASSG